MATVNFANGPPAVVQMPDEHHHGGPGTFETDDTKAMHYHYEGTGVSDILAHTEEPLYMSYDIKETAGHFWKAVMVSMAVSWGACYDAYVTSVPQNLLANEGFILQMATLTVAGVPTIDPTAITLWGVMFQLGQIFAMLTSPYLSDRFGRKLILYLLSLFLIADAVIGIFAKNWHVFCAARWCSGMASGLLQSGLNNYISEVAPVKIRGALLTLYAIMFAVGGVLGTVTLNEIANYAPLRYKIAFYSEFGVLALFLPTVVFAPETPIWYARHGNEVKAKKSMKTLYSTEPSFDIDQEYIKMLVVIEEEKQLVSNGNNWRQYLACFRGTNLRRTIISCLPLLMQQSSGLVVFLGYCTYFFALAGYDKPFQASVIIQCVLLFFVIMSTFLIDKLGRRPLLLGGISVIVLANFALGGMGYMAVPNGGGMIFVSCAWAAAYSLSLGPMAWAYLSESSSLALRAKTMGIATAFTSAFNLIWAYTVPLMLSPAADNWGLKTTFLYGCLSAIGLVAVFFIMPEVKGRTYHDLDEMFLARVPTSKFKTYQTQGQRDALQAAASPADADAKLDMADIA